MVYKYLKFWQAITITIVTLKVKFHHIWIWISIKFISIITQFIWFPSEIWLPLVNDNMTRKTFPFGVITHFLLLFIKRPISYWKAFKWSTINCYLVQRMKSAFYRNLRHWKDTTTNCFIQIWIKLNRMNVVTLLSIYKYTENWLWIFRQIRVWKYFTEVKIYINLRWRYHIWL